VKKRNYSGISKKREISKGKMFKKKKYLFLCCGRNDTHTTFGTGTINIGTERLARISSSVARRDRTVKKRTQQ
jgi:hypothetical protein